MTTEADLLAIALSAIEAIAEHKPWLSPEANDGNKPERNPRLIAAQAMAAIACARRDASESTSVVRK